MEMDYLNEWKESINRNKKSQEVIAHKFGCSIDNMSSNTSYNRVLVDVLHSYSEYYAKYGVIIDEEDFVKSLDKYIKGVNHSFFLTKEYQEMRKSIIELNYQTRKKYYLDYMTKSSEELEEMRQEEINNYNILIENLKPYEANNKLKKDHSDVTFQDFLNGKENFIRCNPVIPFDKGYDLARTYYCNTAKTTTQTSESIYYQAMQYLTTTKEKLEQMKVNEFREYKVNQMKLTVKEKEKIKQQISKFELEEIPVEEIEYLEEIEENIETTTSAEEVLFNKMNDKNIEYPQEFQLAILKFLDNMFLFDLGKAQYSNGLKERKNYMLGALESLHGSIWARPNDSNSLTEIEYFVSKVSSELYQLILNAGNLMRMEFSYDTRHSDYGTKINIHRCNYPNEEPKFGINGIDYEGYILSDGRIYVSGISTKIPSLYDEEGNLKTSSKEVTGTFKCDSYKDLIEITNDALGVNKIKQVTL